jgi:hypothetical protein
MQVDVTEQAIAKHLSVARILKYLDKQNQGVCIYLRREEVNSSDQSKRTRCCPTTEAGVGSETERLRNLTAHGGAYHAELNPRVVRERLLMQDESRSQNWDKGSTLGLKKLLISTYGFAELSLVRTADLYLRSTGGRENSTFIGVELAAQWPTNSTVAQAHVLAIYRIDLTDPGCRGLSILLREEMKEMYTGATILAQFVTVNRQWFIQRLQ